MLFEDHQLYVELVDGVEFERDHPSGLLRKAGKDLVDVGAALDAEQIGDAGGVQSVAVDGRVDAVLERGAEIA